MRFHYSAAALALITTATFAEECPAGYAKSKGLVWTKCPTSNNGKLECATIEVPKDWQTEAGEKMKLHLVRQPAQTRSSRGERSVIVNPGGPGASGIETVLEGGEGMQTLLGTDFHIIGFDPRGVGLTLPYTCSDEDENKKTTRAVKEIEDQKSTYESNVMTATKCNAQEANGALIGTAYVARDVKAIAESLGEDGMIRYLGYSYGTLLGATIAAMFPTKVDRIVLDGNINPQSYYHKLQTESAADLDSAFKRFFELCSEAGKSNCAWAETDQNGAQLMKKFDDFLDSLSTDQSSVVRDKFFNILYKPSDFKTFATKLQGWKDAPSTIKASDNDAKTKRDDTDKFKVDAYSSVKTPKAISGISCSDRITKLQGSADNYKLWLEEYRKVTKYGYDLSSAGDLLCSVWETIAKERFDVPASGIDTANPVLFVNTEYDPVTPMDSAINSAKSFTKSIVLKSSGLGHCSNANPSQELDNAIKVYMASGELPTITNYKPDKVNVFIEEEAEPAVKPGQPSKRGFRYPSFFNKREEQPADKIPAGCTKLPVSSSAIISFSSAVSAAATPVASLSVSASASPEPTPLSSLLESVSASASPEPTLPSSVLVSASVSESMVVSKSESVSASIPAASPMPEVTPVVSASASVSEAIIPSHSESVPASILVASESSEPTPVASVTFSVSASESMVSFLSVPSLSASISASISNALPSPEPTFVGSASVSMTASDLIGSSHSESTVSLVSVSIPAPADSTPLASASVDALASASVSVQDSTSISQSESLSPSGSVSALVSPEITPAVSASITASASASEPITTFQSESVPASALVQQASASPALSQPESYSVTSTPSVSVEYASVSVSIAEHLSASYTFEPASIIASASASVSVSASVSADYSVPSSSVGHESASFSAEILTASASAKSIHIDDVATITASASSSFASSVEHISSSGLYLSSDVSMSSHSNSYFLSVQSSYVQMDSASSIYANTPSSAPVSTFITQTYTAPEPSSSAVVQQVSAASSSIHPDASIHTYTSLSIAYSQSSDAAEASSTPVHHVGSSMSGLVSSQSKAIVHDSYPTSKTATPTLTRFYSDEFRSVDHKSTRSSSTASDSSSVPSHNNEYTYNNEYYGDNHYSESNAYPTGAYPVTNTGKPNGPKITSAPCSTIAWSSQPGFAPVTKTYTTTTVHTITKCPDSVTNCPLNSLTKTYLTTETKTRTTIVATPSSSVTGDKTYPPGKQSDKKSSATPAKETGKTPSAPKNSGYPSTPGKDNGYPVPPNVSAKAYPSQPSNPTGNSPQTPKETKPVQPSHSTYAPAPISSNKPSAAINAVPYPTGPNTPAMIKVCNNMSCSYMPAPTGTRPVIGTGSPTTKGSTTLRTSTPSVSVCFGKDCKAIGTPTGYKPAEFTGAATGNFAGSMIGAAGLIVAFVRFF